MTESEAKKLTEDVVRSRILAAQQREWPQHLKGAEMGNPFATLCDHCCGRHPPPRNTICPNESIAQLRVRLRKEGASHD